MITELSENDLKKWSYRIPLGMQNEWWRYFGEYQWIVNLVIKQSEEREVTVVARPLLFLIRHTLELGYKGNIVVHPGNAYLVRLEFEKETRHEEGCYVGETSTSSRKGNHVMSLSLLYHAFNIRNVEYRSTRYVGNTITFKAEMDKSIKSCVFCHGSRVIFKGRKTRFLHLPPLGRKRCILELIMHRLYCKDCERQFWPRLQFMDGNKRYARSFALTVLDLLQFATIRAVSDYLHIGWDLIKEIHKQKLASIYRRQDLSDLNYLGIDEFSIQKGHTYMTIFVDLQTGRIVHAVEGRTAEDISPFLKKLARQAKNLKAVAVDMSQSYIKAIEDNLGHIDIVFDHYHIAALANRAIDELRKELQSKLDQQGKSYLKGSKFLFLRNYTNLTDSSKKKLQALLAVNMPLFYMYNMKELLRYFWKFKTPERAKEFLYCWCIDALCSGSKPFIRLGLTLSRYKDKILNYFKHPITNAVVEGINNKIKTLKRQVYGFRDMEYFKLRLYHLHRTRYAFAG